MPARLATTSDRIAVVQSLDDERISKMCEGALSKDQIAQKRSKGTLQPVASQLKFLDPEARLAVPFKGKRIKETNTAAIRRRRR
jgi:hypothetical protein